MEAPKIWKIVITTYVATEDPNDDPNNWGSQAIVDTLQPAFNGLAAAIAWEAKELVDVEATEDAPSRRRYTCGKCGRNGHAASRCPNV